MLTTQADIRRLEAAIKAIRDTINQNQAKLKAAMQLESDLTSMSVSLTVERDTFT
jgi:hypothetical protein